MKPSPLQWSLCVTCLMLLFAKLWDWWQGLGRPPAWPESGSLNVGLPLSVVAPELSESPPAGPTGITASVIPNAPTSPRAERVRDAVFPGRITDAVTPNAPAGPGNMNVMIPDPAHGAAASAIVDAFSFSEGAEDDFVFPTPSLLPADEAEPATITRLYPERAAEPPAEDEPIENKSELEQQLKELAARELAAARLRAKSMLLNAEVQARTALEEGERLSGALTEQVAARPHPAGPDLGEARRQGQREGHAIGLRKGEMEALGRIEQVFGQIEGLLDAAPARNAAPTGLPRGSSSW